MELLFTHSSPYARIVRVRMIQLGIHPEIKLTVSHPFDNGSVLLESNPLGKVPVLRINSKSHIMDSQLICRWLEDRFRNGSSLFLGKNRWIQESLWNLIYGVIDASVNLTIESRKEPELKSPYWIDRWRRAIDRTLKEISENLDVIGENELLKGSLVTSLYYLNFRHSHIPWQNLCQKLSHWHFQKVTENCYQQTTLK